MLKGDFNAQQYFNARGDILIAWRDIGEHHTSKAQDIDNNQMLKGDFNVQMPKRFSPWVQNGTLSEVSDSPNGTLSLS